MQLNKALLIFMYSYIDFYIYIYALRFNKTSVTQAEQSKLKHLN